MRVKMRTSYAGPAGSCAAGGIVDVPEAEAAGLVAGGYAEVVPVPAPAPIVEEVAETATAPAVETATAPPMRGRGRAKGR